MRLPVTPQLSTKDGISNKNARLTNCLKEKRKNGELAQVRPGINEIAVAETAGDGNGLVCFNNDLVSIFGANLGVNYVVTPGGVTDNFYTSPYGASKCINFDGGWIVIKESGDCSGNSSIQFTTDFVTFSILLDCSVINYSFNTLAACVGVGGDFYIQGEDCDFGDMYVVKVSSSTHAVTETIGDFYGQLWDGSKFVGKSGDYTYTSNDGYSWVQSGTAIPRTLFGARLAFDGSIYCMIGYVTGTYVVYTYRSTDGLLWGSEASVGSAAGIGLLAIAAKPGVFVIGGNDWIRTSSDAITWSSVILPPYDTVISAIAYNSSLDSFLAVGFYSYYADYHTIILSVDDGATWSSYQDSFDGLDYYEVSASDTGFVAVGSITSGGGDKINAITVSSGSTTIIETTAPVAGAIYDFAMSPL